MASAASTPTARYTTTMARLGIRALDTTGTYRRSAAGVMNPVFSPATWMCDPRAHTKKSAPMTVQ